MSVECSVESTPCPHCHTPIPADRLRTANYDGYCTGCMEWEYRIVEHRLYSRPYAGDLIRVIYEPEWKRSAMDIVDQRKARAIKLPDAATEPEPASNAPKPPDKITAAIALLRQHPEWTDKAIAAEVGCSPANLSKSHLWRAARQGIKGQGQETHHRAKRHRGTEMDEYADNQEQDAPPPVTCQSCGDPAGADANGKTLTHKGKSCCLECWQELTGMSG
jgi:hypothetical protein